MQACRTQVANSQKLQVGTLNLSSSTSWKDFFLQLKQNHALCFLLINNRILRLNVQPFLRSAFDGPKRERSPRGEVEQYSETAATEHPRAWCGRGRWFHSVPKTTKLSTGLHIGHRSHSLQDGGCTDRQVQGISGSLSCQQGGVCPTRENTWGIVLNPDHHTGRKHHYPCNSQDRTHLRLLNYSRNFVLVIDRGLQRTKVCLIAISVCTTLRACNSQDHGCSKLHI